MMHLSHWDRKLKYIDRQLDELSHSIDRGQDKQERELHRQIERLNMAQAQLEGILLHIQSSYHHQGFLDEQEKAIIYWGKQFAQKATQYLQLLNGSFPQVFWARLVERRAERLCEYHGIQTRENGGGRLKLRQALIKLAKIITTKEHTVKKLSFERETLDQKYEFLAIARHNFEMMLSQPQASNYARSRDWKYFVKNLSREKKQQDQALDQLSLNYSVAKKIPKKNKQKYNPLAFDYLNMDKN